MPNIQRPRKRQEAQTQGEEVEAEEEEVAEDVWEEPGSYGRSAATPPSSHASQPLSLSAWDLVT